MSDNNFKNSWTETVRWLTLTEEEIEENCHARNIEVTLTISNDVYTLQFEMSYFSLSFYVWSAWKNVDDKPQMQI